jgi:hypothetical protein
MHPEESQDSIETLLRALVSKKGTTHSNDHAAEVVPEAIQGASRAETHREVTGVTAPNIADILKAQERLKRESGQGLLFDAEVSA